MRRHADIRLRALPGGVLLLAALVAPAAPGSASPRPGDAAPAAGPDSILADHLIEPGELARALAHAADRRPVLLQVGFKALYRSGHIAGSRYVGPGSKPDGLRALQRVLRRLPRQRPLVLYCGCCPWRDCPNVRPALQTALGMGFENARLLHLAKNLQHDWIARGLPFVKGP
jgi:hypothetical protein